MSGTNINPFVVNIVDLQNIANSITGQTPLSQLQTNVANLQQMVQFDTKTVAADILTSFTTGQDIQVIGTLNQTSVSGVQTTSNSMSLNVAGEQVIQINTPTPTYFSTTVDITGWLRVSESAYVKNLYQTSDESLKTTVEPFFTTVNEVLALKPKQFIWKATGEKDLGFIAQEVHAVWPSLTSTTEDTGTMSLAYSRFIPLLLESIRELNTRVSELERSKK